MEFDIKSMKQRAKDLMKSTSPSPYTLGLVFSLLFLGYAIAVIGMLSKDSYYQFLIPLEIVYIIFRNSCKWYSLKVTREEQTSISDVVAILKEKPIQNLIVGLLKEICLVVGCLMCLACFLLPWYMFRISEYVIKDEAINPIRALMRSAKLLKGHYRELMKLDISFLGWNILLFCSLGIAGIYVKPFKGIVYAEFYDYLKAQESMFA